MVGQGCHIIRREPPLLHFLEYKGLAPADWLSFNPFNFGGPLHFPGRQLCVVCRLAHLAGLTGVGGHNVN